MANLADRSEAPRNASEAERDAIERQVARHYARDDLETAILDALAASGKDLDRLAPDDLAPIDEFHIGGRQATVDLAAQLAIAPDMHVLDIGCGIGGAARYLAREYGCRATGIDLTADYVRTAEALTRHVGLADRVAFRQASALALPFAAGTFDGAIMMHVGMNVADKPRLFAEARRVLKAGSAFAVYDVMRYGPGVLRFPLPCAATPETAFMLDAAAYVHALEAAGFAIVSRRDRLAFARAFLREEAVYAAGAAGPPPLGIHILMKSDAPRILPNVVALFEEGVLAPTEIICRAR